MSGSDKVTVSTNCKAPVGEATASLEEKEGMNLSKRGSRRTDIGATDRSIRKSYTRSRLSTVKLPCLTKI